MPEEETENQFLACPKHEKCFEIFTHPTEGALAKMHEKINKRVTLRTALAILTILFGIIGGSYAYTYKEATNMRAAHAALIDKQEKLATSEELTDLKKDIGHNFEVIQTDIKDILKNTGRGRRATK